jgi:hypothetical protein
LPRRGGAPVVLVVDVPLVVGAVDAGGVVSCAGGSVGLVGVGDDVGDDVGEVVAQAPTPTAARAIVRAKNRSGSMRMPQV